MKTCPICAKEFEDSLDACPRHLSVAQIAEKGDPLIGVVIKDRYQLTEVIGRGAMGVVYKANQTTDGKEVAIKVLHTHLTSNQESLKRFQHEAQAASSLMHPNIVRLYDVGVGPGGQPYIAMEFLEGTTLADYMRSRKFLNPKEAVPIIRQVCEALAEAHSHGVLHRDIKPANIMLMNRFGQENFVVVLDFSIAKVIQRASDVDSTTPGLIFGSPAYMSPERFMGRGGDFRSDIYSVGIILWQMLAGRAPFKSSDLYTLMNEHISTPPPSIKSVRPDCDIPPALEETIARALAKKEKDRQENMKQLLAELDEIYRGLSLSTSSAEHTIYSPEAQGTAGGGNGNNGGERSAVNATSATASKSSGAGANIFDINPGLTPSSSVPVFSPEQRKSLEESIGMNSSYPKSSGNEAAVSGIWSKSVANRVQQQSDKHLTTTLRHQKGTKRFSEKLLALAAVGILGITAIVYVVLGNSGPGVGIERKISQGNLHEAADLMEDWRAAMRPGDEESYAGTALNLAKAFNARHEAIESGRWLEQVPDSSKYSSEAKRLLKTMHKS
jgi:serine/threonine protein kinase